MNCAEFDKDLPRYVYSPGLPASHTLRLGSTEMAAMDDHARRCASCAAIVKPLKPRPCREVIDTLVDYIEGTMAAEARDIFDLHLRVCPACVAYLDSYRKTLLAEKKAFEKKGTLDESIPEDLVRAVLAARRKLKE